MAKKYVMLMKNDGKEYSEEQKEAYREKIEQRTPYMIRGVFYRFIDMFFGENKEVNLTLETLEGDELHETEKMFGIEHRNILGYLREENEDFRWVEKIVPIMAGEDFGSMLREEEYFDILDVEYIQYPEELDAKITYAEEDGEFEFNGYNYLVFIREGHSGQYKRWLQAYKFLENINLTFGKKEEEE